MSLSTLLARDEIVVFEHDHTQDDMANWVEGETHRRKKIKCRMVPMTGDEKEAHDIPLMEEAYLAYFVTDPELTLHHTIVYDGKVFDVTGVKNLSGQSWCWEVALLHQDGMQIEV